MTDIELTGQSFKVHVSEKVSTGDYESFDARVTIEGDINHTGSLANGARTELKARLLGLHKDAQEVVERSAENRIRLDDAEDWGVPEREAADD